MNIAIYSQNVRIIFKSMSVRVSTFLLVIFQLNLAIGSSNLYAQALQKKITLNLPSVSVSKALADIQAASGLNINYDESLLKGLSRVSLNAQNSSTETALKQVLAGSQLGYKTSGTNTVMLYRLPAKQSPGYLTGNIVDETGEPLIGVTIKVQGTQKSTITDSKGNFTIELPSGTYAISISYISYNSQRITDIKIVSGKSTPLNIAMKPSENTLEQVVVTSTFKQASISGLLVKQKNAAEISNGISAEQLAATPDKNLGESLKRISGVSTFDNKYVIVRGIGERYNTASLDGTALPSTESYNRSFSFDLIPNTIVDNVVVSKTITPDMNAGFGGGAININTKDIPTENFMSFSAGVSYNDQSTGKEFLSHQRGKYDYLGFDDGRRAFPKDLKISGMIIDQEEKLDPVIEQSKRFKNDNLTLYKYHTAPSQNYNLSIGRLYPLQKNSLHKFGIVGALSYRNTQNVSNIEGTRRGSWTIQPESLPATGTSNNFNTTWGAVINMGLELGKHRFSFRNTYTHIYDNSLMRTKGVSSNSNYGYDIPDVIVEADNPTFTDLLQNKISGLHQLKDYKIEWDITHTNVDRKQKDMGLLNLSATLLAGGDIIYKYAGSSLHEPDNGNASRHNYSNAERVYSWNISSSRSFALGKVNNLVKMGYFGNSRKGRFDWQIATMSFFYPLFDQKFTFYPIGELINPENMGKTGYMFFIPSYNLDYYQGKSDNHAGYLMLDHKLARHWRLVWGARAEYYKYVPIKNPISTLPKQAYNFTERVEPKWQWLPSANLTYSPTESINLRVAYSKSMVRPELRDNSRFFQYNAPMDGVYGNNGIVSTKIESWDFKAEWFPSLGEIISVGAFYKNFDKPAEVTAFETFSYGHQYHLSNAFSAKVYGLEVDLRKSLSFMGHQAIFQNISVYGNLTLQNSTVNGAFEGKDKDNNDILIKMIEKRSLYGQSPYLYNVGIQYKGQALGLNLAYNKMGRKTYFVSVYPSQTHYELPREQLDAQISYLFLNKRLEWKINGGNLLNMASVFYKNWGSYEPNPDQSNSDPNDASDNLRLKEGFTIKYEEGDAILFTERYGRTFSTSLTYKF